jgi:hypothetical protein
VRTRGLTLPLANDTRLFLAGLAAFLALVTYLAVAFTDVPPSPPAAVISPSLATEVAPWTPFAARFSAIPRGKGRGYIVRVTPARPARRESYGAVVQTLILHPKSRTKYLVSLWLRGARPGPISIELNKFRGRVSRYPVKTTVSAKPRWHHFTFGLTVRGNWLGLAMVVTRPVAPPARSWFEIRDLGASIANG